MGWRKLLYLYAAAYAQGKFYPSYEVFSNIRIMDSSLFAGLRVRLIF